MKISQVEQSNQLTYILASLKELSEDSAVPKNVKSAMLQTMHLLESSEELSIKVSRALHLLEEVADDANVQAYTRSQLLNIVSMLEVV